MGRLLGFLVLVLAAIVLTPSLRQRAQPQIDWALTPVYRWETKNRLNEVQRMLVREHATGGTVPRPRDFQRFMERREGTDGARDRWGQPFFLQVERDGSRVGSAGPDGAQGTADDLFSRSFGTGGRG